MQFIQETEHERTLRRLQSCTHTLYSIADELADPHDVELRGDLLIAAENLIDIAVHVTESCRGIAWQYSLTPDELEESEDD